jgi:uncharacterized protein YndB with AHSA1/START domain
MSKDRFVYVTYIKTTPEKLWDALRKPEFTRQYWFGVTQESSWEKGAAWKMIYPDGRVTDSGEVVDIDPPRRLVLKWRNEFMPDLKAEGYSQCVFEIVQEDSVCKLTITHEIDGHETKFIQAVSGGWPKVLSGLKSLLETGSSLAVPHTPRA